MPRQIKGTSAIVFVQTCAAEKRRRRKRGLMEDPARRVMINPAVCEGCGDCSVQSNCISVEPLETEMGRKRTINQSSCNKDYSCIKGFCPSFVTIDGGKPRRRAPAELGDIGALPEPASRPSLDKPYNIAVAGVGGTGVLTIGALLGMAAHIEGKASMILDMSGLAQKGGAVLSHVRLSEHTADVTCSRIVTGTADVVMAADEVVAVIQGHDRRCAKSSRTTGIINSHLIPTADFILNRDFNFQSRKVNSVLETALRKESAFVDFTRPAEVLLGDSIATNIMMMGYAYQKGLLPLSAKSIEQAIEVNGVSIKMNTQAFRLGRLAAHDPATAGSDDGGTGRGTCAEVAGSDDAGRDHRASDRASHRLSEQAARRSATASSSIRCALPRPTAAMARRCRARSRSTTPSCWPTRMSTRSRGCSPTASSSSSSATSSKATSSSRFNLAPPILGGGKDALGRPMKRAFGAWMLPAFRMLAKFRFLRGTALDIFAHSPDRKLERELIAAYEKDVATVLGSLSPVTAETALELLQLPDRIRGYGPVKEKAAAGSQGKRHEQLDRRPRQPATRAKADRRGVGRSMPRMRRSA